MIKFIIPAIIVLIIVVFWEKVNKFSYERFKIKINFVFFTIFLIVLGIIFALLYF